MAGEGRRRSSHLSLRTGCEADSRSSSRAGVGVDDDGAPMLVANEPLVDGVFQKRQQRIEVARDVEHADGLAMDAKLGPRPRFEKLVERARASRQRHERIRERRHQRLALVHRRHDPQVGQRGVADFARLQAIGDHADDVAAAVEHGIGQHAHQADVTAAVNQTDPARRQQRAERTRRVAILGSRAGAGSAKYTDRGHGEDYYADVLGAEVLGACVRCRSAECAGCCVCRVLAYAVRLLEPARIACAR